MSEKWKKILRAAAPTLATALGGPAAGAAVAALGRGLLGKENASEVEIAAAVERMTPGEYNVLKQIETNFKIEMAKLGIDLEKLYLADAADVRRQAIEESKSEDWFVRRARPAFGWIGVGVLAWNYILGPMAATIAQAFNAAVPHFQPINMPEEFWYTFMVWAVGYGYFRSRDKAGGAGLFTNGRIRI